MGNVTHVEQVEFVFFCQSQEGAVLPIKHKQSAKTNSLTGILGDNTKGNWSNETGRGRKLWGN